MSFETDGDRALFFGPYSGAIEVEIAGAKVWAFFDSGYAEDLGMQGYRPSLTCQAKDVTGVARGAAVTVPDQPAYLVLEVRPDGTGTVILELEESEA